MYRQGGVRSHCTPGRLTRSAYREHASGDTIKSGVPLYRMHASPIRGPVSACSSVDRLHCFVGAVVLAARGTTRRALSLSGFDLLRRA